ncbi:hypothetical protein GAY28_13935 [Azospirillum brasilense]|nr:hypothetical protein [Azospirillum brasilense]
MPSFDGDLTLETNGRQFSGWQGIRVTRGIERMPSDFDIVYTERFPGETDAVVIQPGDACKVRIGDDLVITGYIDRFLPSVSPAAHTLRVIGRGKCQDLVDCSAKWPSNQISSADVLSIAQKLAAPYGITVTALTEVGDPIPQINLMWGETPYQVIERIVRARALLAYDGPDGNLILSRVGSERHRTGFEQGVNIEAAQAMFGMDLRFSQYVVRRLSMSSGSEAGSDGDILVTVEDKAVPRPRLRYIVAETGIGAGGLSRQRGLWEAARRAGRSYYAQLTTSTWRDGDGMLWTPNRRISLKAPALKIDSVDWVISEVTYRRDAQGTHADLILMPPDAFEPQPTVLLPTLADVTPGQVQP